MESTQVNSTSWIKSWSLIDDDKQYIVLCANRTNQDTEYFSRPVIMHGWEVKRLMRGCYVAAEITVPSSLSECS